MAVIAAETISIEKKKSQRLKLQVSTDEDRVTHTGLGRVA